MEMVAWLAGEDHSDGPSCTCPVIAALVRAFNDFLADDDARARYLRPLIPKLIHTAADPATERLRGLRIADHVARVVAPLALAARGRTEEAAALRALPPVADEESAERAATLVSAHGALTRAATWLLRRAAEGRHPVLWAAAAAHAARDAKAVRAWSATRDLIVELTSVRRLRQSAGHQRARS